MNLAKTGELIVKRDPHIGSNDLQRQIVYCCFTSEQLAAFGFDSRKFREWVFDHMPLPESVARCARSVRNGTRKKKKRKPDPKIDAEYDLPQWYKDYLGSTHWDEVRGLAAEHWRLDSCLVNATHPLQQWHHRTYNRLGRHGEHFDVVPLCMPCHSAMRLRGPRLPTECPQHVARILYGGGAA